MWILVCLTFDCWVNWLIAGFWYCYYNVQNHCKWAYPYICQYVLISIAFSSLIHQNCNWFNTNYNNKMYKNIKVINVGCSMLLAKMYINIGSKFVISSTKQSHFLSRQAHACFLSSISSLPGLNERNFLGQLVLRLYKLLRLVIKG